MENRLNEALEMKMMKMVWFQCSPHLDGRVAVLDLRLVLMSMQPDIDYCLRLYRGVFKEGAWGEKGLYDTLYACPA
jgi:hypothetical protein